MTTAVVELISNHDRGPPEKRVKRICDLHLGARSRHYEAASDRGGERAAAMYTLIADRQAQRRRSPQAWLADVLAPHRRASGQAHRRAAALELEEASLSAAA